MTPHITHHTSPSIPVDFAYLNYENGGAANNSSVGSSGPFSMDGLVEMFAADDRWPDVCVLGEPERWEFDGQNGKCHAMTALNEASGRGYAIELGTLPREWGPIGPAFVYDTTKINLHRFYSGREPDFYARNRNLAIVSPRGYPDLTFRSVGYHGDIHHGLYRLLDVLTFRRYADPTHPAAILGDWHDNLSGESWDFPEDFALFDQIWKYAGRARWDDEIPMPGPARGETRSMDYLCGSEVDGKRVGGVGFSHVGELANLTTATQYPAPNGRRPRQVDGAVVNASAVAMLVPGSVQVHEPVDPDTPPSDHKRFSFTLDFARHPARSHLLEPTAARATR